MTTKRKSETQNPVNYWWNEFLFVKPFLIETDLSPEDAANHLKTLQHDWKGFISFKRYSLSVDNVDDSMTYSLRCTRHYGRLSYVTAKVEGTITVDSETESTIVGGKVKFGWWPIASALFLLVSIWVIWVGWSLLNAFGFFLLAMVLQGWMWWSVIKDRNNLTRDIVESLEIRKGKEK